MHFRDAKGRMSGIARRIQKPQEDLISCFRGLHQLRKCHDSEQRWESQVHNFPDIHIIWTRKLGGQCQDSFWTVHRIRFMVEEHSPLDKYPLRFDIGEDLQFLSCSWIYRRHESSIRATSSLVSWPSELPERSVDSVAIVDGWLNQDRSHQPPCNSSRRINPRMGGWLVFFKRVQISIRAHLSRSVGAFCDRFLRLEEVHWGSLAFSFPRPFEIIFIEQWSLYQGNLFK